MKLLTRSLFVRHFLKFGLLVSLLIIPIQIARPQKLEAKDRDRGVMMLKSIKNELKKNYYDPNFHGMDVDARFKTAEDKIKQATSLGQVMTTIAQALMDLDDSHTFFCRRDARIRSTTVGPCR